VADSAKRNKGIVRGLIIVALVAVLGYLPSWLGESGWRDVFLPARPAAQESDFQVHFIDVGQGDSILVEAQGAFLLVDGGERGQEDTVIAYCKAQGVKTLNLVVATHPHSDHIGGLAYGVLEAFPVGEVISGRYAKENMPDTRSYETFLRVVSKLVSEQGTKATQAEPGLVFALGEARVTLLAPEETNKDYNNSSVALRIDYGEASVLLTGDAEAEGEAILAERYGGALQADLLKCGHHGSKTSSVKRFVELVAPSAAVISCGAGNSYGHPHPQTLALFEAMGVSVFRTDLEGSLVFASDGKSIWKRG
jgi:competence protein ComEC